MFRRMTQGFIAALLIFGGVLVANAQNPPAEQQRDARGHLAAVQ